MLLVWAVATFSALVSAEVYQWTDANGRVQYSDTKPPDGVPYKARSEFDLPYVHRAEPVKPKKFYKPNTSSSSEPQATLIKRSGIGRSKDDSYPCKGYLEDLERIQEAMRKGYNVRQSNYYHKRKRDISDRYYKECR